MTDTWQGDVVSLVDAYRAGTVSPVEIVQASLDAAAADTLNAVTHIDAEGALAAAAAADVSKPLGGVPIAVKELEPRLGWPFEFGTQVLKGVPATYTSIQLERVEGSGGAVPIGITASSELGLVAYTNTLLHGATGNPWDVSRTPGGSSGGSAAAVAGGIVPIATASDGGGSIRIPAAYTGLFGLKTTFRRIPFGPMSPVTQLMSTWGCLSRSVRDSARWLDVAEGEHQRDMWSLPAVGGWEAGLGTRSIAGLRVGVVGSVCDAVVAPHVQPLIEEAAGVLIKAAGLQRVSVSPTLAAPAEEWVKPSMPLMWAGLGWAYPDIKAMLTAEVAEALDLASAYTIDDAAGVETFRRTMNESMADLFETCDLLILPTNPDDPYAATGPAPTSVGEVEVDAFNTGRLTMASNITGIPSVSIPVGLSPAGLPVGLQIWAPRHRDDWLLDLALVLERERPWPLVAPAR